MERLNPATERNDVASVTTTSKRSENKFRFFHAESTDKRHCTYCDDGRESHLARLHASIHDRREEKNTNAEADVP